MMVELDQPGAFASPPKPKVLLEADETIVDLDAAPDGKRFLLHLAPAEEPPMRVVLHGLPRQGEASTRAKR